MDMGRNTVNFVVDLLSGSLLVGMITTGLIVRMVLSPGSGQHRMLWGLTRHEWGSLHYAIAIALLVVLLVHLAMHWQWVCTTVGRWCRRIEGDRRPPRRMTRIAAGTALLALTIVGFAGFVLTARAHVVETRTARGAETLLDTRGTDRSATFDHAPQQARQRVRAKEH